jgi:hypothetical protein
VCRGVRCGRCLRHTRRASPPPLPQPAAPSPKPATLKKKQHDADADEELAISDDPDLDSPRATAGHKGKVQAAFEAARHEGNEHAPLRAGGGGGGPGGFGSAFSSYALPWAAPEPGAGWKVRRARVLAASAHFFVFPRGAKERMAAGGLCGARAQQQ